MKPTNTLITKMLLVFVIGLGASPLRATTQVWNGGGADNNFSTALNWVSGVAPVAGNDVQFDGSTRLAPNMQASYSLNSLTFNAGAGAFGLTQSGTGTTLTLANAGIVNSSANNQSIGIVIVHTTGAMVVNTGTSGKIMTFTGELGPTTGAWTGGLTVNGNGTMKITFAGGGYNGGPVIVNGATLDLKDNEDFGQNNGAETLTLNGGTIQVDAVSASDVQGGVNLNNHFLCQGGVTLGASGGTFSPGVTLQWSGAGLVTPSSFIIGGTGQLTVAGAGTLQMSNSFANTYSGGTLVVGKLVVFKASNLGTGTAVTVNSGGTLTLNATSLFPSSQKLLLNTGSSVVLTAGANTASQLSFDGGTTFKASGTWGAVGSAAFHQSSLFTGTGTINVTTGPTTVTTLQLSSGTNPSLTGNSLTFTADVSTNGLAFPLTGTLQFQDYGTNLGPALTLASDGSASYTTSAFLPETNNITAVYSGDDNNSTSTSGTYSEIIEDPPAITSPTDASTNTANAESTVIFSITATGSSLSYQWSKGGVNISNGSQANHATIDGATTPNLTLTSLYPVDAGNYLCTAQNGVGSAASPAVTLIVNNSAPVQPVITSPSSDSTSTVNAGTTVNLSVTATGGSLTYQWKKGGINLSDGSQANRSTITGAITPNLTLAGVYEADAADYTCNAHNTAGNALSPVTTLVVNDPAINTQPVDQTVAQGTTATFSVGAAGTSTLTYQWYFNSIAISGATASSYSKTVQPADAGPYYCVVTNALGTLTSSSANLTLIAGSAGSYWDLNGTVAGAGGPSPSATWDTGSLNWNSSSSGTGSTGTWIGTTAYFSAGSDATGSYTVTLNGTLSPKGLFVLSGSPTFTDGQLKFVVNGTYASNYVASGLTATFNTTMGGAVGPDKWGAGTAVYNAANIVTGGNFSLNQGAIAIGNDAAFSTVPFIIGDPAGANVVTVKSADTNEHTLANALTLNALNFTFDTGGDLTFSGAVNMGLSKYSPTSITVKNNSTFSGVLTNTAGIIVNAASTGTLTLGGGSANTYGTATNVNGNTTVNGGTLNLAKTSGNAIANGTIVLTGGSLQLAAANQIADTVPMKLNGGTFNTGGFSETLGALALTANSTINAGGNGTLAFADSSAVAWTAGKINTISNWSGSLAGGGANQIIFGATSAGLTSTQVGQVLFLNPAGSTGAYAAQILPTGEVVPVGAPCSQTNALLSISANPNGTFQLAFIGTPQAAYYIISSTNVTDPAVIWTVVPGSSNTVSDPGGHWYFTATNSAKYQFYRSAAVTVCP